jgi:DNA-binding MarR family transcriptional regulator
MTKDDIIDKANAYIAAIYSNLMLHEIDGLQDGLMKDLTFHEIHTLEIIGDLKDATMNQIARHAKVTQSTITTMIDKLVRKGVAERVREQGDRRVIRVKLTEEGRKAYNEHQNIHREVTRQWLSALDEGEQRVVLEVMGKIAGSLRR